MANIGVDGTLLCPLGAASVGGYTVEVYDEGLRGTVLLGSSTTSATGDYSVRYSPSLFSRSLVVRLYDVVRRLIDEWRESGVSDPVLRIDMIEGGASLEGWLYPPLVPFQGNSVELLVDNAAAWGQLTNAAAAATEMIHFSQLQFELDYMFQSFVPDPPALNAPTTGDRLELELEMAAARGVDVKVLMNDFVGVGYPADMWDRVEDYFNDTAVETRAFKRSLFTGEGAMHAKIAVIDGNTAFSIGSGLIQEYFDGTAHLIDDPRRGEMTWPGNQMRVPIHDVSAKVVGPSARTLDWMFDVLWTRSIPPQVPAPGAPAGPHTVHWVTTLPARAINGDDEGRTDILDAYQRAIRYAEDFIYIENQYLTDEALVDSLVLALGRKPGLQLIMLLNPKVDVPYYGKDWWHRFIGWQDRAIARLLGSGHADRVGLFSLWSHEIPASGSRIIRNYVHSKVAVVDDKWATVGSANLDGVSLSTNQLAWPLQRFSSQATIKSKRAVEVNAVLFSGVGGQPATGLPDLVRRTLWAEHLGYDNLNHPDLTARPPGGWLKLWEAAASRHTAALNATPPQRDRARILKGPFYVPNTPELLNGIVREPGKIIFMSTEEAFLYRCGVRPAPHKVEDEVRSFDFNTGTWF